MVVKETLPTEAKPARLKMSYEEFLAWADEDVHAAGTSPCGKS